MELFIFLITNFLKYKIRLFKKKGISFMNKRNSIEIDTLEDLKLAKSLV